MHTSNNHLFLCSLLVPRDTSGARCGAHAVFLLAFLRVRPFLHLFEPFPAQLKILRCNAMLHKLLLGHQLEGVEGVCEHRLRRRRTKVELFNVLVGLCAACHQTTVQLMQSSQKGCLCLRIPMALETAS